MQQTHTHTRTEPYANEVMREKKVKMNLFYESMRVCVCVRVFETKVLVFAQDSNFIILYMLLFK